MVWSLRVVFAGKPPALDEHFNAFNYWKSDHGLILDDPEPPTPIVTTTTTKTTAPVSAMKTPTTAAPTVTAATVPAKK